MNDTNPIGAIVTGGDFQALGVVRTLAPKGIPVILLDSDHCVGKYSRYAKGCYKSPPLTSEKEYVDFLTDFADRTNTRGWVVFPNSDEAVYVLSRNRDLLSDCYRITTPPWEVIRNVYIKKNTYQLARKHGIPIPATYYPENLDELLSLDLSFPVVIKPSIRDNFYSKVRVKAYRVDNRDELKTTYESVCSVIDPSEVLVQDLIPGGAAGLYSFCPFFKNGEILTGIAARRARQHPMDFGHASTYAETVDIPQLRDLAEAFLRRIGYYGLAEVEFMHDPRTGEYKLLEVNPRIWGWHTLAIAAGVDLPYLVYRDMLGEKVNSAPVANHAKWVRLTTDIPTVLLEIAKGRMSVRDYLATMKGKKEYALFSLQDPLPFLVEIALIPYLWRKRGF
jgi:predicted ATP-grasp superfamily ATP-dependent carboligase